MADAPFWVHHFRPYTYTHLCVVLAFLAIAAVVLTFRRIDGIVDVPIRRRLLDRSLGWAAFAVALYVQAATLWPSRFDYRTSLPLHICDFCMIIAPLALTVRYRVLRVITYFWGLGLSSISFIYPDLYRGPGDFQFWIFWACHAVIVGCALYDIVGRGFRPMWRDWVFIARFSLAYVLILFPVDAFFHLDYGYIGQTRQFEHSPVDFLGPWPLRVPIMFALAMIVMLGLLAPWVIRRRVASNRQPQIPLPTA